MSKKLLSLALALVMSLALCIPAWAMDSSIPTSTSTETGTVMQIDQFLNDASFETITREEYIADKASHENISYTEAEQIVDATRIRMTLDGFFEMSKSDALSLGINLELFNVSYSNGVTTYLRANVSDTHIETLQESA